MNLGEAIDVINAALELDRAHGVQNKIQEVLNAISNMASNPQDSNFQTELAANLKGAGTSIKSAAAELSPAEHERLRKLGALNYFDPSLLDQIVNWINSNPSTPAVARDSIQEMVNERSSVLEAFASTKKLAMRLGWAADIDHDKIAEIGFTIPLAIFENRFDNFIKELEFLKRFVGSVYEAQGQDGSDIEVASLSTTDPLILLAVSLYVAKTVGQTITWALGSWKSVEEIREIRSKVANIKAFSPEEVAVYDHKITDQISAEIKTEAARLVAGMKEGVRKNELENAFNIYLRQLLARIERGMTVEIKLLEAPEGTEDASEEEKAEFAALSDMLAFPKPSGEPVLKLTDEATQPKASKAKPAADAA